MGRPEQLGYDVNFFGLDLCVRVLYKGSPVRLLRDESQEPIGRPEDLSDTVLVVIGLWNMGIDSLALMRKVLRPKHPERLEALVEQLRGSIDPVVRRCIDAGLPVGLSVPLPFGDSVRCPLCSHLVTWVPCPSCNQRGSWVLPDGQGTREETAPPLPDYPSAAPPGSFQKIRVFQSRLARGEALFHPNDVQI